MEPNKSKAESAIKRLDEIKEHANIIRIIVSPFNIENGIKDMENESIKMYPDGIDYIIEKALVDDKQKFCGNLYIKPSNCLFAYQASYSQSKR